MIEILPLSKVEEYCFGKKEFETSNTTINQVRNSFDFLVDFSRDKIIYGINTGFGPMVQFKVEQEDLNQLQYNLIRSHACGAGHALNEVYARSVVVARLNNFLQANSGISPEVITLLKTFLDKNIIPEIYEHGGVGASGDLVQLAHLALNLIGEGYVYYEGKRERTADVFSRLNIKPLALKLRDGLGIINGTSCMTGMGAINLIYSYRLFNWAVYTSSVINEVIESFDDSFSEGLNSVKRHPGQQHVAKQMREFLYGSKLIRSRKDLFSDEEELKRSEFKNKIQEYYSIRCVPQILGPVWDTLEYARTVVENELSSTNDNPVVIPDLDNVFHGGNFHGDYVSLEMDKVRIAVTKLTMLAERQLNFLLNARLNRKFPLFLNAKKPGLNFGLQGLQFTATSTTAESQALSNSVYVHSIPNNNDNQDIVSMGTNSAVITKTVITNAFQVMSVLLMGVCQAIDLLPAEEKSRLSPKTMQLHQLIRQHATFIEDDRSQAETLAGLCEFIKENPVTI